jgi:ABC-type transporter Mla subunit MlaD
MTKNELLDAITAMYENFQYLSTKASGLLDTLEASGEQFTDFDKHKLEDLLVSVHEKHQENLDIIQSLNP